MDDTSNHRGQKWEGTAHTHHSHAIDRAMAADEEEDGSVRCRLIFEVRTWRQMMPLISCAARLHLMLRDVLVLKDPTIDAAHGEGEDNG